MNLSITDLKKGTIFLYEGEPFRVTEYAQKVMGRGGSIVNVRIKSLISGKVLNKTLKGNEQLESADLGNQPISYLYCSGGKCHFMNDTNFEQLEIDEGSIEDKIPYLKEGDKVTALILSGILIGVELPKNVVLKVSNAEGAVKGDTSSSITKDAVLETGLKIKVPAFIKTGDNVSVDTTTGQYRERASKN